MHVRRAARFLALASIVPAWAWSAAGAAGAATPGPNAATWEQWFHLPGVFDVAGPRSDDRLVAAAHTRLLLVSTSGEETAFASSYAAPDGSESYIALSPGMTVDGANCGFARDEVLALDLHGTPPGVLQITSDGTVSHLATVGAATSLGGITLDTVGDFGHRLLVIGPAGTGKTEVAAIDCNGKVTPIATVSTTLEGGIAVAPRGFGAFGGQLIATNENDGSIYAVSPAGRLSTVVASGVPAGGDIGVESAGFVPTTGDYTVYYADRGTPNNPHPGTDNLLRLSGTRLSAAGAAAGDLLAATEGGATVVDVRCAAGCVSTVVATGPAPAHGEGRLLMIPGAGPQTASTSGATGATGTTSSGGSSGASTAAILGGAGVAIVILAAALVLWRRRRPPAAGRG